MSRYIQYGDIPEPAPATPPHTPPPQTDTIQTALSDLLIAESLTDVTLISNQGTRHPAVRAILACRSPYFRNLLYGDFRESGSREVKLQFSSATLRNVLTYIYTDTGPLLQQITGGDGDNPKRERIDPLVTSRGLADLVVAADYLDIPGLSRVACSRLFDMLETSPEVACTVVQLTPASLALHHRARAVIRQTPRQALGVVDNASGDASHGAARVLSHERMAEILSDRDIFASDTYLFKVLKFWASHGAGEDRRKSASELSKLVNLERCRPSFLRDFVRPSGLVSEERIRATFEQQALEAERGRPLFNNLRGGSVFSNGAKVIEGTERGFKNYTLGPWLTDGKHEWTFRVHSVSPCLWFGFTASRPVRGWAFFAMEGTGWGFCIDGKIRPSQDGYRSMRHFPSISKGETVKVILNLTRTGSVTVSTATTPLITAFSGLRQKAKRFIPAVCMNAPANIELVEELHHLN